MALKVRKNADSIAFALAAAHNARQEAAVASFYHADVTQKTSGDYTSPTVTTDGITAAASSSEATAILLANDAKAVINRHFADTRAHNTAVSSAIATADATALASAITLANAIKAAVNTHYTAAGVHFTNDATTIAAVDATDQGSVNTLLNEIRTEWATHIASAPAGFMIQLIDN